MEEERLPDDSVNVTPTPPLREAAILVAGVIGVGAIVFLLLGFLIDRLVVFIPEATEARVLSSAADAVFESFKAQTDEDALRLEALTKRLSAHWPNCPYRFRLGVLDSATPNALAIPGGVILVTRGLLERAKSENEIAFVLGHELGHFAARDHLRGLGRAFAFQIVVALVTGADRGLASSLVSQVSLLQSRSFGRGQEAEADHFGLRLVALEYGHVAGFEELFRHLDEASPIADRKIASYFATHPRTTDRVEKLREQAVQVGWPTAGALTAWGTDER